MTSRIFRKFVPDFAGQDTKGGSVLHFSRMRLFVGIPLAAPAIEELKSISMRLRSNGDGLRWSMPESWHVTLQFLGNCNRQQYECIVTQLRKLHSPPVSIGLDEFGCFDRTGIFFVGVKLTPELAALQQEVMKATGPCGFISEDRPYRPHITLARGKGQAGVRALSVLKTKLPRQTSFTRCTADAFVLYESFTQPTGSRYEIRERFQLGRSG